METIVLVFLAILPAILLFMYINNLDKHKEPVGVLRKLFSGGILSVLITLVISLMLSLVFTDFFDYEPTFSLTGFLYVFLGIGLVEELSKFLMLYVFGWHDKELDETYDVVLYCMVVALGFATAENIMYSLDGGFKTSLFRFFTAVPGHVIDAAFMGYFLYLYRMQPKKKKYLILAILVPSLAHGIYDFIVYTGTTSFDIIIFVIYVIFEFVIAKKLVNKMAKGSRVLPLQKTYCSNCGTSINTRFCPNCGKERP